MKMESENRCQNASIKGSYQRDIKRLIAMEFHATIFHLPSLSICVMRIGSVGKNICSFIVEESACIINYLILMEIINRS
jgi:hypothetical protein